jgi:hypothetical protein
MNTTQNQSLLLARLRHHVTGAVERGQAVPIAGIPAHTMNIRTQIEAIATHLGWDINEAKDATYQEATWSKKIVTTDDHYYCAHISGRRPIVKNRDGDLFPTDWEVAEPVGKWVVYRSKGR